MNHNKHAVKSIFCIFLVIFVLLLMLFVSSCKSTTTTSSKLNLTRENEILEKYFTEQSIGFDNKNGTESLYIFPQPIAYMKNDKMCLFDTSFISIEDKTFFPGYSYTVAESDIKSYYPETLDSKKGFVIKKDIEYSVGIDDCNSYNLHLKEDIDFIGNKKQMLIYKNEEDKTKYIKAYGSGLGANIEYLFKNSEEPIILWLDLNTSDLKLVLDDAGYIIITDCNNEVLGIVQKPLQKNSKGKVSNNVFFNSIEKNGDRYKITVLADKEVMDDKNLLYFSFEIRQAKQPDTQAYSEKPDLNTFLSNIFVTGRDDFLGEGYCYTRFFNIQEQKIDSSRIKSAFYHTYNFSDNDSEIEIYRVNEDWCSVTSNWNTRIKSGSRISHNKVSSNSVASLDLTSAVREWLDNPNGDGETFGVLIKSRDGKKCVFSSADSSLYMNYTEIIINK